MRTIILILLVFTGKLTFSQFCGIAGSANSSAMHADSSAFIAWAKSCTITRGFQDISNTSLGHATVGDSSFSFSKADAGVVSLGDGGVAIVTFSAPITNGPGYDFAVFENSFNSTFLELAFVEVSSDGINYVRFPSVCNLPTSPQFDNSAIMDATKINNLAGKYRVLFGTPFDLQELSSFAQIDVTSITHVKLIDVVGSISTQYASYDSNNNIINDPWPTPFNSSGFDLDAVGVIHQKAVGINEIINSSGFTIYPNPAQDKAIIHCSAFGDNTLFTLTDVPGKIVMQENIISEKQTIDISKLNSGIYFIILSNMKHTQTFKLIKE